MDYRRQMPYYMPIVETNTGGVVYRAGGVYWCPVQQGYVVYPPVRAPVEQERSTPVAYAAREGAENEKYKGRIIVVDHKRR